MPAKHLFCKNDEQYVVRSAIHSYLEKAIRANKCAVPMLEEAECFFLKHFGRFYDDRQERYSFDFSLMRKVCDEVKSVMPILHWGRLPILNKYLMINSGLIPEKELAEFYSNYDMLCAMLKDIRGEGERIELNGDQSLDQEMTFAIYTRRWGYQDTYFYFSFVRLN